MNIIHIILIAIVLLVVLYTISTYNSFISLRERVEEAFSTMDVYLKQRFDLIPNLVETVKGYAGHEKSVFENIAKARANVFGASNDNEKFAAENQLGRAVSGFLAVAENYPELKANTNFSDLIQQLKATEADIANARKYYNGVVRAYNNQVDYFPSNILAGIFKFERRPYFEANEEERENVKVSF